MKNSLIVLTMLIFFIGIYFLIDIEGLEDLNNSISIENIESINSKYITNIKKNKTESQYNLIDIKCKDIEIPYDKNNNVYYFSTKKHYNFDVYYDRKTTIKKIVSKNNITIIAYNKNKYKIYNIKLINLPIVNIDLNNKSNEKNNLISNKNTNGYISIWNENNIAIKNSLAKLKVRGSSSIFFDKKSYTINFIDESGKDLIKSDVLGMNADYKYSLNSMYEDNSKIRDVIGMRTWEKLNDNNGLDIKYVEVIINNNYYGLYALQEVPTQNSLNIDKDNGILYKINGYIVPKLSDFNTENNHFDDTEIIFKGNNVKNKWTPLENLVDLVYYSDDERFKREISKYVDIDKEVNYFILLELMYASDNRWKNSIFIYEGGKIERTAWDLDGIFGLLWDTTKPLCTDYNPKLSKELLCEFDSKALKTYLEQRLWQNNVGNFRQKVAKRWKELRSGFLETESFVNYANIIYDEVTESGAREREHERWPDGGYSTDNSFIEKFIRQRLPYLDSQFLQYLDDSGEN